MTSHLQAGCQLPLLVTRKAHGGKSIVLKYLDLYESNGHSVWPIWSMVHFEKKHESVEKHKQTGRTRPSILKVFMTGNSLVNLTVHDES